MTPVDARLKPAGKTPEVSVQVYGGTPPVAASEALYGTPTEPAVKGEVVLMASGVLTEMVSLEVATACLGVCESVTCTLKLTLPRLVGVPLMVPLLLIVRPAGKLPDARAQV